MRSCFTSIILFTILLSFEPNAQVINGDFEQWDNGNPVGWFTSNFTEPNITQSIEAHGGASAVKGEVILSNGNLLTPLLIYGEIGEHGLPVSERHANLTGYYKLSAPVPEKFSVLVIFYKMGEFIGVGGLQFAAASEYTQFTVPVSYNNDETPDSCQISITIGNPSAPLTAGSYFLLDDLTFEGIATGVGDETISLNSFSLEQNYPNPFNPSTKITYSLNEKSFVTLKVYNVLGKEIAVLENSEKEKGVYTIDFNASELSNGIYFYKMQARGTSPGEVFSEARKMILVK